LKQLLTIALGLNLLIAGIFPMANKEFIKIPQLIEHFNEHQSCSGHPLSFIDFLALHYFTEHGHSDHCDLPDLHLHSAPPLYIHTEPQDIFNVHTLPTAILENKDWYTLHYHFSLISTLLQPPQTA